MPEVVSPGAACTGGVMAEALSARQIEILRFIAKFTAEYQYPPTIREIGTSVDISSTSVVNYNLNKLESLGLILRRREVSRGLSLNYDELARQGVASMIGAMPPASASKAENGRRNGRKERSSPYSVPVLGHIAAGSPIGVAMVEARSADEFVDVAASLVGERENLFALRVRGDSMIEDSVLDGDIVILQQQATANDGEMVAAWNIPQEETTLKRFYRRGNEVELKPANPQYKSIILPADQVLINGKVVAVIRHYH